MSAILIFLAALALIITWWMAQQRLMSKPWLEVGHAGDTPQREGSSIPTAKIGLGVFLAVVGALFTLLISAYFMRMGLNDWWAVPIPGLLWFNTALLVASSLALQWTKAKAQRGNLEAVKAGLGLSFVTSVGFLVGQILAWRQLTAAGYLVADNPANSFFYLITGMHGLHILGGLVALGRTSFRALKGVPAKAIWLSVDLCAMYWHFMLLVWLILFALLAGWANDFVEICRQLLT
ncbi:cytochrome c oxidase subunit 3 [Phyllobacterium sp. BT25]|uniref:Cytochrome c oxidase subunit 3 n=1 Tax=Phyllobacterium pellucidum TaxID=2740464 RepID=A0A849VY48_9HYPH|nr:cytochrome c oxidase subunit 3 [Phyllobacterium pellucidum]NTS33529.1 cytochrome c oxidase subunit 3 [Phyllobacterium pellucidum]